MEDVAGAADAVDVPNDGVVLAHFKRDAVGEGAAVEGHEGGGLGGGKGGGGDEVCKLRVPDGVIGVSGLIWSGGVGEEGMGGGVFV